MSIFQGPTVTEGYSRIIRDHMYQKDPSLKVTLVDVTSKESRQNREVLDEYEYLIFGFPVYADYAPSVIHDWIPSLSGHKRRCSMFFTYGARSAGYSHYHTKCLLEDAGFSVVCSAEFLGPHTFNKGGWEIMIDRPDDEDIKTAGSYVDTVLERFRSAAMKVFELQKPMGYKTSLQVMKESKASAERGWFHPFRKSESCSMCRKCEMLCPTGAFSADRGLADPDSCIKCMHCVHICPDGVLGIDERVKTVAYAGFLADYHLSETILAGKKSRLISEAGDTVQ